VEWSGFSQLADKVYLVLMIAIISSRFQASDQSISGLGIVDYRWHLLSRRAIWFCSWGYLLIAVRKKLF
jgi:hypothetical protein